VIGKDYVETAAPAVRRSEAPQPDVILNSVVKIIILTVGVIGKE
jgi:hypothetical protein